VLSVLNISPESQQDGASKLPPGLPAPRWFGFQSRDISNCLGMCKQLLLWHYDTHMQTTVEDIQTYILAVITCACNTSSTCLNRRSALLHASFYAHTPAQFLRSRGTTLNIKVTIRLRLIQKPSMRSTALVAEVEQWIQHTNEQTMIQNLI
jgi:hypothetical protein